jgi:hypothetical protein
LIIRNNAKKRAIAQWLTIVRPARDDAAIGRDMLLHTSIVRGEPAPPDVAQHVDAAGLELDRATAAAPDDARRDATAAVAASLRGVLFAIETEALLRNTTTTPTADQLAQAEVAYRSRARDLDQSLTRLDGLIPPLPGAPSPPDWSTLVRDARADAELARSALLGPTVQRGQHAPPEVTQQADVAAIELDRATDVAPDETRRNATAALAASIRGLQMAIESEASLRNGPTPPTPEELAQADVTHRTRARELDEALAGLDALIPRVEGAPPSGVSPIPPSAGVPTAPTPVPPDETSVAPTEPLPPVEPPPDNPPPEEPPPRPT